MLLHFICVVKQSGNRKIQHEDGIIVLVASFSRRRPAVANGELLVALLLCGPCAVSPSETDAFCGSVDARHVQWFLQLPRCMLGSPFYCPGAVFELPRSRSFSGSIRHFNLERTISLPNARALSSPPTSRGRSSSSS